MGRQRTGSFGNKNGRHCQHVEEEDEERKAAAKKVAYSKIAFSCWQNWEKTWSNNKEIGFCWLLVSDDVWILKRRKFYAVHSFSDIVCVDTTSLHCTSFAIASFTSNTCPLWQWATKSISFYLRKHLSSCKKIIGFVIFVLGFVSWIL